MTNCMLTTIDNPFDPFTQYDDWYAYDENMGHCSTGLLARIAKTSESLSDVDNEIAIENGIDRIVQLNPNGLYKKVTQTKT